MQKLEFWRFQSGNSEWIMIMKTKSLTNFWLKIQSIMSYMSFERIINVTDESHFDIALKKSICRFLAKFQFCKLKKSWKKRNIEVNILHRNAAYSKLALLQLICCKGSVFRDIYWNCEENLRTFKVIKLTAILVFIVLSRVMNSFCLLQESFCCLRNGLKVCFV